MTTPAEQSPTVADGVVLVGPGPDVAAALRAAQAASGARCVVVPVDVVGSAPGDGDDVVVALADASLPVVAVLRGPVAPSQSAAALAADLRVADVDATLRLDALEGGTSASLPDVVGAATARHLLLVPGVLDAARARELGLVHEVHEDAIGRATALARAVAARPAGTGAAVRRALRTVDVAAALERERRLRAVVERHPT